MFQSYLQASLPDIADITQDAETVSQNLLQLEVYYKELNVESLEEAAAYDVRMGHFVLRR